MISDRTAALAALLVAVGALLVALPFVAALTGIRPPTWSGFGRRVGRVIACSGLLVVGGWVARERDGPAGFTALVAAVGATLLALLAGVIVATGEAGTVGRAAAAMALVSGGVCLLAIGLAADDNRLSPTSERAAAVVGLLSIVGALFPFVRPLAFAGWAGWGVWLAIRLSRMSL